MVGVRRQAGETGFYPESLGLRALGSVSNQHPGVSRVGCPCFTLGESQAIPPMAPRLGKKEDVPPRGVGKTSVPVQVWHSLAVCPWASSSPSLCHSLHLL